MALKVMWHTLPLRIRRDYLPVDEQENMSSEESPNLLERDQAYERKSSSLYLLTAINVFVLAASLVCNSWRVFLTTDTCLNTAVKETSYYSPILKDLDIELRDERMNGTLWPTENPSFSRLEPSPEVEAIWNERFEPEEAFAISREDVVRLGKDPDLAVKLPNEIFGLGLDAYIASFDSLHKTHCLNELRKMTFADYGEETPTKKKHGKLWWIHLRHCVDMLLQDLVCHADGDIITYTWVDTQHHPWADMSINRRCRNWDQVLDWGRQRYVAFDKLKQMRKPTEARILPFEKGYYEMFEFDDSEMFPNGTGYVW